MNKTPPDPQYAALIVMADSARDFAQALNAVADEIRDERLDAILPLYAAHITQVQSFLFVALSDNRKGRPQ